MRIAQLVLLLVAATLLGASGPKPPGALKDFALPDAKGKLVTLREASGSRGVVLVFICNHCPMARRYYPRLNALAAYAHQKGFTLLAINPMDSLLYEEETRAQMAVVAEAAGFAFPYLQDAEQGVSRQLKVAYTPEAYVLTRTPIGWVTRYHGAIDDGVAEQPGQTYLGQAVSALAAGKRVPFGEKLAVGCEVKFRR